MKNTDTLIIKNLTISNIHASQGAESGIKYIMEKRILLFILLTALYLAFSWFLNPVGYVTGDSGEYHFMVRTFIDSGGFYVDNGYEEHPSPELLVAQLVAPAGKLVAKSPEVFTLLMAPGYALLGYKGLFMTNAIFFIAISILLFKTSCHLFPARRDVAYWAVGIYTLCTYAWEYSQSSYPHLPATFLILLAFYCVLRAISPDIQKKQFYQCLFWAGMAGGCALGVRLDSIFAWPGILLPILLHRGIPHFSGLAMFVLGSSPFIVFVSLINKTKFGTFNPFSYGGSTQEMLSSYIPIAMLVIASFLLMYAFPILLMLYRQRPFTARITMAVISGCALFFGSVFVSQLTTGIFFITINAGTLDPLWSGVKSSLLQSCPYLALLVVLGYKDVRTGISGEKLLYLLAVPVVFIIFYGYFSWHGSQTLLNMRYLNPGLPFLALLTAYVWNTQVMTGALQYSRLVWIYLVAFSCFIMLFSAIFSADEVWKKLIFSYLPLILALIVAVFTIAVRYPSGNHLKSAGIYFTVITFAWASAITFGRDYLSSASIRIAGDKIGDELTPLLEDNAVVFGSNNILQYGIWTVAGKYEKLIVASPDKDDYRTFPGLVNFHLQHKRQVYLCLTPEDVSVVLQHKLPASFNTVLIQSFSTQKEPYMQLYQVFKHMDYPLKRGQYLE